MIFPTSKSCRAKIKKNYKHPNMLLLVPSMIIYNMLEQINFQRYLQITTYSYNINISYNISSMKLYIFKYVDKKSTRHLKKYIYSTIIIKLFLKFQNSSYDASLRNENLHKLMILIIYIKKQKWKSKKC